MSDRQTIYLPHARCCLIHMGGWTLCGHVFGGRWFLDVSAQYWCGALIPISGKTVADILTANLKAEGKCGEE